MKFLFISFLLIPFTSFAQVGINTSTPYSTLQVNGSYAGNFKEITASKTLDINDQLINVIGSTAVTITLPDGTTSGLFNGRIYTIKNSSSANVTINGSTTSQLLRLDANNIVSTFTLNAGSSVQVVRNTNSSTGAPFWEIIQFTSSITNNNNGSKSLQYAKTVTSPIDANTPTNSVVTIGNLKVRFNGTSSGSGYIEYQTLVASQMTVWFRKAGSGGTGLDKWGTQNAALNTWYKMAYQSGDNGNNITPNNRDVSESIIIIHQTKEVYRVTSNLNGNIPAAGTIPAAASSATLFVERLD